MENEGDEFSLSAMQTLGDYYVETGNEEGIENIRKSRMIRIQKERDDIERTFERGNQIYPEFRLSLLVRLEA